MSDIHLPKCIAHRGARDSAPENTLAAFLQAKHAGCSWVEFDVQCSKEGVPMVMHDTKIDRTTNGQGDIDAYRLAELKTFDAGRYFSPDFIGETIPTLDEALAFLAQHGMHANIELKSTRGNAEEDRRLAYACSQVLSRYVTGNSQYLVSSFSPSLLTSAREYMPEVAMGLIVEDDPGQRFILAQTKWATIIQALKLYSLHVNHALVNRETMSLLTRLTPHILCWTVNDVTRAKTLFDLGVTSVFTDMPSTLVSMVGKP